MGGMKSASLPMGRPPVRRGRGGLRWGGSGRSRRMWSMKSASLQMGRHQIERGRRGLVTARERAAKGARRPALAASGGGAELLGEGLGDEGLAGARGTDAADAPGGRQPRGPGSPAVLIGRGEHLR